MAIVNSFFADLMNRPHVLVAGATGSGKSCLVDGFINTLLHFSPEQVHLVLIDPKRTELIHWADSPHARLYASEPSAMIDALQWTVDEMERRFSAMQSHRLREYPGRHIFVIVDELADLMTTHKHEVFPLLQRIAQLGRAAHIHLWACTQCPLREIIPTPLKCNFADRIALRTASRQDSRNIIDRAGAEMLPDPKSAGKALGIVQSPSGYEIWEIPYTTQDMIEKTIQNAKEQWS